MPEGWRRHRERVQSRVRQDPLVWEVWRLPGGGVRELVPVLWEKGAQLWGEAETERETEC